jgi:long-subunit acyl-CoA synthetase (AMP-forming)
MQVDGKAGPYEWLTYRQVAGLVENVASALVSIGLAPRDKVAVYGSNSPEWMVAMQVIERPHSTSIAQIARSTCMCTVLYCQIDSGCLRSLPAGVALL